MRVFRALLAGAALAVTPFISANALQDEAVSAPPLEAFATYAFMDNVGLSPDGRYLAMRRLPARNADYIIEIYDTEDLSARPVRLGAERMSIQSLRWVNSDYLYVTFRQQVRDNIEGINQGAYEFKTALAPRNPRREWIELPDDASLVDTLPEDDNAILILTAGFSRGDIEGRAISDLVTRDFVRFNLRTERSRTVLRGNTRLGGYRLDNQGNVRFASEVSAESREVIYYSRPPGASDEWNEFLRFSLEDYREYGQTGIALLGFDPENPNHAFVRAHRGQDTLGVHLIDVNSGQWLETIYQLEGVDVQGSRVTPDVERRGEIAGFAAYVDGQSEVVWINERMSQLQAAVDASFPGTRNFIVDCYNDCAKMLIFTQGSKDPGSYFLITDGQAQFLGGQYPLLEPQQLGREMFIRYPARDGRSIPGIVTLPPTGDGPFPLVVVPHGGPWVSETRAYDEWASVLASHGYMVLQPQYRGSEGYGLDHWLASWGQWGYTMQDDKDDGVAFLVEQGLADPEQVAMFGWSYGGYAAFAATVRSPSPYQCTIAGAGVSDINRIQADFTRSRIGRQLIREGYRGLDPADEVANANVPILVIHGEIDQRVPIYHSNRFVDGLRQHNKEHRYIILEDADHFSNTIDFDNQMILFSELLTWLSGPCGMATPNNQPGAFQATLGQPQ